MKKPMYDLNSLKSNMDKVENSIKTYKEAIKQAEKKLEELKFFIDKHHEYNEWKLKTMEE